MPTIIEGAAVHNGMAAKKQVPADDYPPELEKAMWKEGLRRLRDQSPDTDVTRGK